MGNKPAQPTAQLHCRQCGKTFPVYRECKTQPVPLGNCGYVCFRSINGQSHHLVCWNTEEGAPEGAQEAWEIVCGECEKAIVLPDADPPRDCSKAHEYTPPHFSCPGHRV